MSGGGLRSRGSDGARRFGTSTHGDRTGSIVPRRAGVLAAAMLIAAAGLTALQLTASPAGADTSAVASLDLCAAPAPGQMRCLGMRRTDVSQPAALAGQPSVATPAATPAGYSPADLTSAYQLNTSLGSGQTVAVVDAYDNPSAEADLAVYRAQYGLPACTTANGCFRKVNQAGASSPLPAANSGWAAEIALDVDMVSAVCPQCNILLVEAASAYTNDLGTAVDTAVALGAKFVSNSYGGGDSAGQAAHFDHPGVVITASTGDNGYGVSFPASAPTVTAVGGTRLVRSASTRGWTETAWTGAGSGCSSVFGKPAIQTLVSTGCANRAVADVSAVADPGTGVAVYHAGGWGVYGGTSASAPIVAAVYALAGTPGASDYPNSYPYQHSDSLNDVTTGSNGSCGGTALCTAKAGWDGPTGLGTPAGPAAFSASGVVGPPTRLGATLTVGSPVVPGLSTTASVTPIVPPRDEVTSISWKAGRTDCTFSAPTAADTTVSCPATATGSTTVTATVTDTLGTTKVVTMPLVFNTTGAKRNLAVSFGIAGQSGSPQSACVSASTPLRATVVDALTGGPVRGVSVGFSRQSGTALPVTLARGTTDATGVAASSLVTATAVTLTASTLAVGPFNAYPASSIAITTSVCTSGLTATVDRNAVYYGDPVTVSGTATHSSSAGPVALGGAPLQVNETVAGRVLALGRVTSAADGSYRLAVRPTLSGTVSVVLAASPSWTAASAVAGGVTVNQPATVLTASANATDVGYAAPVLVSGSLQRDAGGVLGPVTGGMVSIRSTAGTGTVSVLGSASVAANGTWKVMVAPRASGVLSAVFAGTAGQPAATAAIGSLTVGTWTPAVTLAAQASQQLAGAGNRLTGTVTRSYGGVTGPAPGVPVRIYLQTSTGASVLLSSTSTTAAGAFTVTAAPVENGTLVARVASVAGYADAASAGVPVAVTTKATVTGPAYVGTGLQFALTATVTAPRAAAVTLEGYSGGSWTALATVTSTSTGSARFPLTAGSAGTYLYRARVAGDSRGADGLSANLTVTVR
ncbi:hypothetical protein [Jatrophihabitans sp.]|uniref:hypothetical protein n=1 Tax=Jatrophihabitans sp. TaxID=1932789 RepID=UPI002CC840FE|nr:hypothetical protein [Jatrophihabitans sp.]